MKTPGKVSGCLCSPTWRCDWIIHPGQEQDRNIHFDRSRKIFWEFGTRPEVAASHLRADSLITKKSAFCFGGDVLWIDAVDVLSTGHTEEESVAQAFSISSLAHDYKLGYGCIVS